MSPEQLQTLKIALMAIGEALRFIGDRWHHVEDIHNACQEAHAQVTEAVNGALDKPAITKEK